MRRLARGADHGKQPRRRSRRVLVPVAMTTITSTGALLPRDLLDRVTAGDPTLEGTHAETYGLAPDDRLNNGIAQSWNRLGTLWEQFTAEEAVHDSERAATRLTRRRFTLPLLEELGFVPLPLATNLHVDGKDYPISHEWAESVPVHLVGARVPIDRRTPGIAGAAKTSPHGLVQEFLNRSDRHLWAIISNGRLLRLLRDNASLTRTAFVEFDLAAMFGGEQYNDFVVLWLTCHRTRFEGERPDSCLLERWTREAASSGLRALERQRDGVERAVTALGTGFIRQPNSALKEQIRSGELTAEGYHRQVLRLVYRLLFLLVAEARELLLTREADAAARKRYERFYSMRRLVSLADQHRGSPHGDLWESLAVVVRALSGDKATPSLELQPLGSFLWSADATPDLDSATIDNAHLLDAVRALTFVYDSESRVRRFVDYRNLGAEELGSVYESLLELHAEVDIDAGVFCLANAAGHERKATGSYYTPPLLIARLLDDALNPALDEAERAADAEDALLALRVLDPACGSGHFLIAAAHRIAGRLASVRSGDAEPAPPDLRAALRDVIGRCLYGIDINPMAVELCKVSLWIEANQPGRPLGFLDHHIVVGNSLLGATPELIDDGLPDAAFKALADDDKQWVKILRRANKDERKRRAQEVLALAWSPSTGTNSLAEELAVINAGPENSVGDVTVKADLFVKLKSSPEYLRSKLAADAYCAAFVTPKTPSAPTITDATVRSVAEGRDIDTATRATVQALAERYRFTHLHLIYPDVFTDSGGFDVVIGNPPFLSQLRDRTVTSQRVANFKRHRYGEVFEALTDTAYLFLEFSCRAARLHNGRVGLVQPESLLAADGATALRRALAARSTIESLWVAGEKIFGANVLTCFVVLRNGLQNRRVSIQRSRGASFVAHDPLRLSTSELAEMSTWGPLISDCFGVPRIDLPRDCARVGDGVSATADFRDQYYGLAPFVREYDQEDCARSRCVPLITVGLIEPMRSLWGESPTKFDKRRWDAPVVEVDRLRESSDLGDWLDQRLVPKLLVATQSKVIEVLPDEAGTLLPSVPVISVIPSNISLWHAAALLSSPVLTAWSAAHYLGASLSTSSIKLSARQIHGLPMPRRSEAWDEAAVRARDAFHAHSTGHRVRYLQQLGALMCDAFEIEESEELLDWWSERLS